MKRKIAIVFLTFTLILSCAIGLCACNGNGKEDGVVLNTGSRPDYSSLIGQNDSAIINAALSEDATEAQKKSAVMALFNVANNSRKNTNVSLMLQSSDAGVNPVLGSVIMHGFNLKYGDKWYYQLAAQASAEDPGMNILIGMFAGLLKIAYTAGDGDYYYTVIKGEEPKCDCSPMTFPYATFSVTKEPICYNQEDFKTELHYLDSMHEINNMKFCEEIIADGAKITYNASEKFYRVEFSVDMNSDSALLEEWFALPKEDMAVGGQKLEKYNYYNAVLEVWDNGYAKSFKSEADRSAGMGSGSPTDTFEYLWKEDEILATLKEDQEIERDMHDMLQLKRSIEGYLEVYSTPELAEAQLGKFKLTCIIASSVIGAILLVIIIVVIVVETLLKKGKLPKLAAKRAAKKQKRLEKKAAKANKKSGCNAIVDEDNSLTNDVTESVDDDGANP